MPELSNMARGKKYHTGIAKAIFGKVIVAMTCFDIKIGGGYKSGVREMTYGNNFVLVALKSILLVYAFGIVSVFDESIMHTDASVL